MNILYEDEHIIVVEKQSKQFIHSMPGEKASKHSLLVQVRDQLGHYVYPINRLDRPVSGIVFFSKQAEWVQDFQDIWHVDSTKKLYLCLHLGELQGAGHFDSPLSKEGVFKSDKKDYKQHALTLYRAKEFFPQERVTLTEVEIKTGRHHQIRRHFRKVVKPIIGDTTHGKGAINRHFKELFGLDRIFLHCHRTDLILPYGNHKHLNITCDLPQNLKHVLEQLRQS
jgi:23S rRNA-/tRNA-specific pseudouridylate synthase